MEQEVIRTDDVSKVFVEFFEPDQNGKITVQTRKFNKEDRADYFINTLPERGIEDCSKKVITKIHFKKREWESVLDMVRAAIENGDSRIVINRKIKPFEKENFSNMGLEVLIPGPEQFILSWLDSTKIKNL